ncbi:hypothetical protein AMES_7806 [Amycolatopsis mediterranei S699]|uniref:Secreted protein n=2 Tax=Amycolatopsis mediterranei TaxID=33910 RepID=A0A0H3DIX1_AMYMU|nr:hypothetical protein [Amycolatopsis mediterranei]ADJ49629.1 hypothetical protein AMED_7924 [Amycolatopsis mediterranei U32]AEK46613.1 hypothetical protein RAM_40730 [Amycolatopsis mediterranei S699]AFO81339.1 hypothetical protein AMES_7806 [Amycolatopsis mediterranei S699]AGT88467.1 hypothetical protein B737_7806 [Amycolatopsis mediterranei RB]KDO08122.1 hypothetical protein DV26_27950 [Amycolatopsis mediterranei]
MAFARRTLTGLLTIAAGLGLGVAAAIPASAAESGSWHAYGNTNPITSSSATWHCAGSKALASSVVAQVCAIRSVGGGAVQGAVIVRNNRASLYSVDAAMDLYTSSGTRLGDWACASSGVAANSWSVCFGRTLAQSSPVNSVGSAKGVNLGVSPNV